MSASKRPFRHLFAVCAGAAILAIACRTEMQAAQSFGPPKEHFTLRATFVPESAAPGSDVVLRFELEIDPTWHLYGKKEPIGEIPSITLSDTKGLTRTGAFEIPDGVRHEISKDPEIVSWYLIGRNTLQLPMRLPAELLPGELEVAGTIGFMQCTELMCDPPGKKSFTAKLKVLAAAALGGVAPVSAAPPAPDERVPSASPSSKPKVRIISAVFDPPQARAGGVVTLRIEADVERGWHVYGAKETQIGLEYDTRPQIRVLGESWSPLAPTQLPDGELHEGEFVRGFWIADRFQAHRRFRVPLGLREGASNIKGEIEYQPCTEEICEKNERVPFEATLRVEAGSSLTSEEEALVAQGSLAFILLAIGWGLFTLVMPCTYPMIPITVSFFTKQASARGGRVLPLVMTYGLGIVAVFIVVGLAFAPWIQPVAAHWITNLVIGILFLFFGVVLFGAITLQPPAFLMNLAGQASSKSGYLGAFLMGTVLVLTSFTCTAPFVANLLGVGAKTGSTWLVILGMGVFGLTVAIPFVLLALVPGWIQSLPRSGEWMNTTKVFLGFVEVAAALKFISNADLVLQWGILPKELFLYLWAAILGAGAAYLLGTIRLKSDVEAAVGPARMTVGLIVLCFAAYCLYGALGNRLDPIMLAIVPNYSGTADAGYLPEESGGGRGHSIIKDDYAAARDAAVSAKKKLLVNFTGFT